MSTFSADSVRGFSIDELRVNCSKLPAPIQAQWKVNGKKTGLTAEQCRFVLNRQHAEKNCAAVAGTCAKGRGAPQQACPRFLDELAWG